MQPQHLVLNRQQIRSVDRRASEEYGMSGLVLMENAGRGCAEAIVPLGVTSRLAILCGKGNNGGDGFVIARHLDNRGVGVEVLVFCDPAELRGDALANYDILARSGIYIEHYPGPLLDDDARLKIQSRLSRAELIVDALLGTGATGTPREPLAAAIKLMNGAPAMRLAVDIPSGLDCDTGAAATPTVEADHTCTFVAMKPGMLLPSAAPYCGEIQLIDIGVPRRLLAEIVAAGDRG